ncbi:MAG TPA: helix-turn-helix domain-containing protein, partial [Candidatus Kapabacteria bacterium]
PPLRNRRDDIPFLVDSILRDIVSRHSLPHIPHIEGEAIEFLVGHEWRGNIRELRNVLEQLSITSFSPSRGALSGEITKDDVLKALTEHQVYFDDGHSHLSPVHIRQNEQQDRPELALIYKALIELRGDIAEIREHLLRQSPPPMQLALPAPSENGAIKKLEDVERDTILTTIEQCKGNRKLAAELLGISDRTLYRKLQEYEEK